MYIFLWISSVARSTRPQTSRRAQRARIMVVDFGSLCHHYHINCSNTDFAELFHWSCTKSTSLWPSLSWNSIRELYLKRTNSVAIRCNFFLYVQFSSLPADLIKINICSTVPLILMQKSVFIIWYYVSTSSYSWSWTEKKLFLYHFESKISHFIAKKIFCFAWKAIFIQKKSIANSWTFENMCKML